MADRYYCPDPPREGRIVLGAEEARHLARAARREVGEEVEVFDGLGGCVRAEVTSIGKDRVELAVRGRVEALRVPRQLTLYVAPPKGERFDWLVEKATELGVTRLVSILAERSVVDPRSAKLDRLRRAIIEASKQCGRSRLMELADPIPWARAMATGEPEVRLMADATGAEPARWPRIGPAGRAAVAVGPEGGWTDAERRATIEAGWTCVSLGPTRLRVETAAIAACALILNSETRS